MHIRYITFLFVCVFFLSACTGKEQPIQQQIKPFSFTNQKEQPFGTEDLEGSIWIANFIFTNCETVCPPMMFEMATLQNELKDKGIDVIFVSFTVDPAYDSPKVLQEYVRNFTEDETNWQLLSGFSQSTIEQFAMEQFKTIVQKPQNSTQVVHSTNFYLVDDEGYVRNEYNYIDESYSQELIEDIEKMN